MRATTAGDVATRAQRPPARVAALAGLCLLGTALVPVVLAEAAAGCLTAADLTGEVPGATTDLVAGATLDTVMGTDALSGAPQLQTVVSIPVRSLPTELSDAVPPGSQAVSWEVRSTDVHQRGGSNPSVSTWYLRAWVAAGVPVPVFETGYLENGTYVPTQNLAYGELVPGSPGTVRIWAAVSSLSMAETDVVTEALTTSTVITAGAATTADRAPAAGLSAEQMRVSLTTHGCLEQVQPAQPVALAADAFVDSIGVNTHLNFQPSNYRSQLVGAGLPVPTNEKYPQVEATLSDLGIRHVRDGLPTPDQTEYIAELKRLARLGVRYDLITTAATVGTLPPVMSMLRELAPGLSFIEPANEVDNDGETAEGVAARQRELYAAAKADPVLRSTPVLAPSLANRANYGTFGGLQDYCDVGNLHIYAGGEPFTRTTMLDSYAERGRLVSGNRPFVVTESGYTNLGALFGAVTERASGTYLPKTLLTNFAAGIQRTYLYELLDEEPYQVADQGHYGIVRSDYTSKPAATTTRNLIRLLNDPGPAFTPGSLAQSYNNDAVRHLLLQKRDGTFSLVLWQDARVHTTIPIGDNRIGPGDLDAPAQAVTVGLDHPRSVRVFRPDLSTTVQQSFVAARQVTLSVPATGIVVLELRAPGAQA